MGRALWYFLRLFLGFRVLSPEQLTVVPKAFSEVTKLDENIEQANKRGVTSANFFWEFHLLLRDRIRAFYPHDCGMFNCIARTGAVIQSNQLTYVIYRRITLAVLLGAAFLLLPGNMLYGLYGNISTNAPGKLALFSVAVGIVALVLIFLNRAIKVWYDSCINNTTANLVVHISSYNSKLFIDGFQKCINAIDGEGAEYGSSSDETQWPLRAKKWAILAFWNYRRIEQIERITENYAWDSQRTLSFVDGASRVVNLLMFSAFGLLLLAHSGAARNVAEDIALFGNGSYGLFAAALVVLGLGYLGWEHLGKEEQDVFEKSMFAPEKRELWIRSADFREEFATQVYKDKSRIQRERPFRGGIPSGLQHAGPSHS